MGIRPRIGESVVASSRTLKVSVVTVATRVPTSSASSVFQIVPQMSGTMNTIMDAQRSRGLETEGSLITRAKSFLPLISPVVMSSLINTRERAIALEIRGFESGEKKTYLKDDKMKNLDRVLCVGMFLLIFLVIVARIFL